jgi:hypothetical protein
VAAASESFAQLLAEAPGAPPTVQDLKRRLGKRFDQEAAAALLKLWQEGRLPASP